MSDSRARVDRLRSLAVEIFKAGVDAADPRKAVHDALRIGPSGRPMIAGEELSPPAVLRVVAFGKAGVTMAKAASDRLPASLFPGPGVVAVNKENHRHLDRFRVHVSGHPVPDAGGVAAARDIERYLADVRSEDAVLVLVSGGGSALLPAPAPGIELEDKVAITRLLLASGASIQEVNAVRKHLSTLKGGGLARRALPSRVEALILSDVIGDDLSSIASGPTAPDPTTFADVAAILSEYDLLSTVPGAVRARVEKGLRGELAETPKAGDPVFERVENRLVGSNSQSLAAARQRAEELGFQTFIASAELCGEAREAALVLAEAVRQHSPDAAPFAVLAGGETTVTLRGSGRGGRNQELALAFALEFRTRAPVGDWVLLSGGTDGRDGPTDAAGGLVDPDTIDRIRHSGLDPAQELEDNNSHAALSAADGLLVTGATGTNVADLQVLLVSHD